MKKAICIAIVFILLLSVFGCISTGTPTPKVAIDVESPTMPLPSVNASSGAAPSGAAPSGAAPSGAASLTDPTPSESTPTPTEPSQAEPSQAEPSQTESTPDEPAQTELASDMTTPSSAGNEQVRSALPLDGFVIGIDPGHQKKANSDKEPVAPGSDDMKKRYPPARREPSRACRNIRSISMSASCFAIFLSRRARQS